MRTAVQTAVKFPYKWRIEPENQTAHKPTAPGNNDWNNAW